MSRKIACIHAFLAAPSHKAWAKGEAGPLVDAEAGGAVGVQEAK